MNGIEVLILVIVCHGDLGCKNIGDSVGERVLRGETLEAEGKQGVSYAETWGWDRKRFAERLRSRAKVSRLAYRTEGLVCSRKQEGFWM